MNPTGLDPGVLNTPRRVETVHLAHSTGVSSPMRLAGKLQTWNDERGFGFIAPTRGGPDLFVHISAFPQDGTRPTAGESVSYELGRGNEGRVQAVHVWRSAIGKPDEMSRRPEKAPRSRRPLTGLLLVALLVAAAVLGYSRYLRKTLPDAAETPSPVAGPFQRTRPSPPAAACDGRTHCSQMTSCAEATFFLKNCPGTEMDGNHDGVPCEQQWCTGPFAH